MDRWACVDAFRFPLQVLLSEKPEWMEEVVAVLDRDHPQGRLLYLNRRAKEARLSRGMRYGQALALLPHLRAEAVEEARLQKRADEIAQTLGDFSPRVERDETPGLFWLDASGLSRLYPDWRDWVEPLKERLRQEYGVYICVVIGFSRFGTFAAARATGRSGAFDTAQKERQTAQLVSLESLDLEASTLKLTRSLGIHTVGELLALPPEGLRRRLGPKAFDLYRRARGDLAEPIEAFYQEQAPTHTDHLDYAEKNSDRLLFLIKGHLHPLLAQLEKRGERLAALIIVLYRRESGPLKADIRPAEPTDDALLLLDLVRLRLEQLPITQGITDVVLTACGERTRTEQLRLFAEKPPRDIDAANRALARLRAEFGPDAVLHVGLRQAHLPESRFELLRLEKLRLPHIDTTTSSSYRPAVRRFYPSPIGLNREPDSPIRAGPHIISGGWWVREVHRDYHLIQTTDHRLLWVFYDRRRKKWYVHAEF